ncbi:MAG: Gfo/Idh/MocA family protein [Anaerolineales bacterium]|jgi:predicted dehydrogenase
MKDKASVLVGIVGTGFIGPVHLEALRRNNVNVVGLADATAARAAEKAAILGIGKSYESYQAMLADPGIDVIHLATPNYLHYPHAKAALEAGKHVVCEKPLAMNSAESADLVRIAQQTGKVNVINFNIRFYPMVQQARTMVQNGEIGDIFILQGSYLQDWLLLPTDWNWRLEPELGGTLRAVGDIGSHWLDLISFITDLKVVEVFADLKTFHPIRKKPLKEVETFTGKMLTSEAYEDKPIKTEDYASILLHYENGVYGVLTVSQVSSGRKNRIYFEINGSKSSLSWNGERPNELWIGQRSGPNQIMMKDPSLLSPDAQLTASYPGGHNEGFPDTFKQLYNTVYNYILAGDFAVKPDFPTFADGHYEQVLCEAIESSAHEGRWVQVNV